MWDMQSVDVDKMFTTLRDFEELALNDGRRARVKVRNTPIRLESRLHASDGVV
jgi:hypothetical protein